MSDPSIAIQNALEAELRANAGVKSEFGGMTRLYTLSAPNDAPFPFILIGEDQIIGDDTECADGSEIAVTIHVFARQDTPANSRLKSKSIAGAVRAALTKKLTITGHVMDDWIYEGTRYLIDPDGLTAHAVLNFTYLTTADA